MCILNIQLHSKKVIIVPKTRGVRSDQSRDSNEELGPAVARTLRSGDEGWLVLDVTAASDRWLLSRNKEELSCRSFLYIFEINSLSVASFAIIFSHSEGCLFTLLIVSFVVQKLLILIRSHLFIFAFISNILGGGS